MGPGRTCVCCKYMKHKSNSYSIGCGYWGDFAVGEGATVALDPGREWRLRRSNRGYLIVDDVRPPIHWMS